MFKQVDSRLLLTHFRSILIYTTKKNAKVEYLDYQITVTQLKGPMLRNLNLKFQFSIFDRYPRSYLRFFKVCGQFMGVKVGVASFLKTAEATVLGG